MAELGKWLAANALRLALVALALGAAWWLVASLIGGKSAETEARLGRNQADAAHASGGDAVDTVGKQGAAEAAADDLTRRNDDDIRNAEGADAPVAPAAAAAGMRGLCRRAAYRDSARCRELVR